MLVKVLELFSKESFWGFLVCSGQSFKEKSLRK